MMFKSSYYYTHESAKTQNVSTGYNPFDKYFFKTGSMFYFYNTKQTDWVMTKLIIITSLQTFYHYHYRYPCQYSNS